MTVKRITIALVCILIVAVVGALILGREDGNPVSVPGSENRSSNAVTSDKWVYETEDGMASLIGYNGRDSVLEIPSEIEGFPVTVLGEKLFAENTRLREVTIPDSVVTINFPSASCIPVIDSSSGIVAHKVLPFCLQIPLFSSISIFSESAQ